MLSKLAGIAVVALSAGLLLAAPAAAGTKTVKGTCNGTAEGVGIGADFSFNGSDFTTSLNTISETATFPTDPSLNGSYTGQSVQDISADTTNHCSFTGAFGEPEGATASHSSATLGPLLGDAEAFNGPDGSASFEFGQTATGCIDLTDGALTFTGTNKLYGGPTGPLKNATGTKTFTIVGLTLAAPASPGYGYFQWGQFKCKVTWYIPSD